MYIIYMSIGRRSFFKKLGSIPLVLGFGGLANSPSLITGVASPGSNSKVQNEPDFPVAVMTKYYFPVGKNPLDLKVDMEAWGDSNKFQFIYRKMIEEKKISFKLDSYYEMDHLVSIMYFSSMDSYKEYCQFMTTEKMVNTELQKALGYRVTSEVC